ncbi:MAG: hypothetical protein IT350_18600 [Deltaproteobacteria bacterium]|nr:hypothetical protein [Deltaproteobacteria bacterium]
MKRPHGHIAALGRMAWAVLAALAFAAPVGAGERVTWTNHAALHAEYDDNVYKTTDDVEGDLLARVFFDSKLDLHPNRANLVTLDYTLGAKKFADLIDQDTLINQVMMQYENTTISNTYIGGDATLKLRNIRDGEEDYNKVILNSFAGHYFARGVSGQVNASYTRFDFRNYDYYDYWTQAYGIELNKSISHALGFGVHYLIEDKNYPFFAFENVVSDRDSVFLDETDELRQDTLHEVGFKFSSFYFVLVNFAYDFQVNDSNSYGDSYYHHRLRLMVSKSLTPTTNLHLFAVANFRDSDEQVLIPHSYSVEEDDENYNQLVAKLNRKVGERIWLEARYARFWSQYSVSQFNFSKNVYSLGASFNF